MQKKWANNIKKITNALVINTCKAFAYESTIAIFVDVMLKNSFVAKNESGIDTAIAKTNCKADTNDQIHEI